MRATPAVPSDGSEILAPLRNGRVSIELPIQQLNELNTKGYQNAPASPCGRNESWGLAPALVSRKNSRKYVF